MAKRKINSSWQKISLNHLAGGINSMPRPHVSFCRPMAQMPLLKHHKATMDDKQFTTLAKSECTQLEHRLACSYLFLQNSVANIFLRLYLFPRLPGRSMFHLAIVVAARLVFSYPSRAQYNIMTGGSFGRLNRWLQCVVVFLPAWLVDLMLGGCYYECAVRSLAKEYCAVDAVCR